MFLYVYGEMQRYVVIRKKRRETFLIDIIYTHHKSNMTLTFREFCECCATEDIHVIKNRIEYDSQLRLYLADYDDEHDFNGTTHHYPVCFAIESGNVELARYLWGECPLYIRNHERELKSRHLSSCLHKGYVEMADLIMEITTYGVEDVHYISDSVKPYDFFAKHDKMELVRRLILYNEVELIQGKYNEPFRWFMEHMMNGRTSRGRSIVLDVISPDICKIIYQECHRRRLDAWFVTQIGTVRITLQEKEFVAAFQDGTIPHPRIAKKWRDHSGEMFLHILIKREHYLLARWYVDHDLVDIHICNRSFQSAIQVLLYSLYEQYTNGGIDIKVKWNSGVDDGCQFAKFLITRGANVQGYPDYVMAFYKEYQHRLLVYHGTSRLPNDLRRILLEYVGALT
jgi:hypothetical protein